MEIFEPIALLEAVEEETLEQRYHFWKAIIYFRQNRYSEALEYFQKAGPDPVVDYWLKRLEKVNPV